MSLLPRIAIDLFPNPRLTRQQAYGPERQAILGQAALAQAQAAIRQWPGYAPTPLRTLPGLAAAAGVAAMHYKDEGGRFGLGSFKALGGAYAVGRQLCRELSRRLGRDITLQELSEPRLRESCAKLTVTCATDGNHGRSVAWGARMFGCACVIYVHATVSAGRVQAIEHYGARVVRTDGNYDQAVRQADHDARDRGWFVISDTSYPGYTDVPRDVMQGYQIMVDEAAGQLPDWPTHIFVQAGVGGFAAAVCGYFWERASQTDPARRPRFIVVEPDQADCLMRSARAGRLTPVTGALDTLMAGLACGEVSILAWEILEHGADAFCTVSDAAAVAVMRLLANPPQGDPAIVAGESAVAGLAGALGALQSPQARQALALGPQSRLLFFGSEADTDPVLYRKLIEG